MKNLNEFMHVLTLMNKLLIESSNNNCLYFLVLLFTNSSLSIHYLDWRTLQLDTAKNTIRK